MSISATGTGPLLRRGIAGIALVGLSVLLAGCLASKRPLFDESTAVTPLTEGRYGAYERGDTIRFKQVDTITIKRAGTGYDFVDGNGHAHRVTLYPHSIRTFTAQAKADGDDYVYVQLEPRGTTILVRNADCASQDKARLAALGVVPGTPDCRLDNVSDPKALFATLRFGRSSGKLIRK